MRIQSLGIWRLNLAFQYPFKHSSATHGGSENLVVAVTTDQGVRGYGEGIPRAFVTGETMDASLAALTQEISPRALSSTFPASPDLLSILENFFPSATREQWPAACCAVETALLDAAGRTLGVPVSHFLGTAAVPAVEYSAVLPLASEAKIATFLKLIKDQQMRFVKVKVGGDRDLDLLSSIRRELGPEVNLRVDANGAWSAGESLERIRQMAAYGISAVEQPVPGPDLAGMARVSAASPVPIVADESLVSEADARRLIDARACQIFNLRLSKLGGVVPALRLHRLAAAAGLRCQLGCHVGETSILAAAGRHFALTTPDLLFAEGSFAPYLLTRDPVADPVVFQKGGLGLPLPGPGLGIRILEPVLDELASFRTVVT